MKEITDAGSGINIIKGTEGTVQEMEFAGYCAWYLSTVYPGHPWPVECHDNKDGMDIRVRHWAMPSEYCYFISPQSLISPTSLHESLKRAGGQILEALGLPLKGDWDGELPKDPQAIITSMKGNG